MRKRHFSGHGRTSGRKRRVTRPDDPQGSQFLDNSQKGLVVVDFKRVNLNED